MKNKKLLVIGLGVLVVGGVILYLKNENDTKKNIEDIENEKKEFERKKRERQYEFTIDSLERELLKIKPKNVGEDELGLPEDF
ncbi:MAG: hypothetical protein FJX99_09630 [Bacteroidetes bacterium]|nr:hypothetical protein [Bacteroidota bacterium]